MKLHVGHEPPGSKLYDFLRATAYSKIDQLVQLIKYNDFLHLLCLLADASSQAQSQYFTLILYSMLGDWQQLDYKHHNMKNNINSHHNSATK